VAKCCISFFGWEKGGLGKGKGVYDEGMVQWGGDGGKALKEDGVEKGLRGDGGMKI